MVYHNCISLGVDPESFWNYTMAEALSVCKRPEVADRMQWNHTSSILSLLANVNSSKSKQYKPADFNPYEQGGKGKEFQSKEEVMEFVKSIKPSWQKAQ